MNQGMNPYQAPTTQTLSQYEERDWKWLLFSFDGRISRSEYWKGALYMMLGAVLVAVIMGIAVALGGSAMQDNAGGSGAEMIQLIVMGAAGLLIGVPILWASLAVGVKRWHDRGKSGLWVLIGFVPYIGSVWVLIECGCLRGTPGPNEYGPDPLA